MLIMYFYGQYCVIFFYRKKNPTCNMDLFENDIKHHVRIIIQNYYANRSMANCHVTLSLLVLQHVGPI